MLKDISILEKLGSVMFNFNIILSSILKEQKEPKINLNQFRILNILRLKKAKTAVEIADILGITPASMAKNIEFLVEQDHLKQDINKNDKRQKDLKITIKGKLKIASIAKQIADKVAPARGVLTQEEKGTLLEILTKVDTVFNINT